MFFISMSEILPLGRYFLAICTLYARILTNNSKMVRTAELLVLFMSHYFYSKAVMRGLYLSLKKDSSSHFI